MTLRFDGRVAIVTGAGGGIGRTHALELGRRGCAVVVNDLGGDVAGRGGSGSMAEAVAGEIRAAGGKAVANRDSVATAEGARAMVAQAIAAFGRIDVLVNNAGIMRNALLEDTSDEDWDAVIATHLTGSFRLTRAVWPHMKAQGYGRIVYTASSAGLFGTPMVGGYGAAKAGIAGLMHVAAHEGAPHGIVCNAILPNAISRMALQAAADWAAKDGGRAAGLPPQVGHAMDPAFNTPLAVYLASEACTDTRGLYSQCLGRMARVFVGVTEGWRAGRDAPPTVEAVAEHWNEIRTVNASFAIPETPNAELAMVLVDAPGPA
ncbi:MAG: SDR family NAD(P)-dependent oxidoreductase [Novosphingobium sp.]